MKPRGGLKLHLEADRDDRRIRWAQVTVAAVGSEEPLGLVTDAQGRLSFRLSPGDYRLHVPDQPEARFSVRASGWTPVHLRLD